MKLYIFLLSNAVLLLASIGLASASSETSVTYGFEADTVQRHLRPHEMKDEERAMVTPEQVEKMLEDKVPVQDLRTYLDTKDIEGNIPPSVGKLNVKSAGSYHAKFNPKYRDQLVAEIPSLKENKFVDLAAYLILLRSTGSKKIPFERVANMLDNGIATQDQKAVAAQLEDAQFLAWYNIAPSTKKAEEKFFSRGNAATGWKKGVLERYDHFLKKNNLPADD